MSLKKKRQFSEVLSAQRKGGEEAIIVVGGYGGAGNLNSTEAILFEEPCALPDLPVPGFYGPAVFMVEGPNGKEVVSDHNMTIRFILTEKGKEVMIFFLGIKFFIYSP